LQLLDLCSLDIEYSLFPKNVLAATAIVACKPTWPFEQITRKCIDCRLANTFDIVRALVLTDDDLYICSEWMRPFFDVLYFGQNLLSCNPLPATRPSAAVPVDEIYSIQIHNVSLDLLVTTHRRACSSVGKL
jgi:hypothetical protein